MNSMELEGELWTLWLLHWALMSKWHVVKIIISVSQNMYFALIRLILLRPLHYWAGGSRLTSLIMIGRGANLISALAKPWTFNTLFHPIQATFPLQIISLLTYWLLEGWPGWGTSAAGRRRSSMSHTSGPRTTLGFRNASPDPSSR